MLCSKREKKKKKKKDSHELQRTCFKNWEILGEIPSIIIPSNQNLKFDPKLILLHLNSSVIREKRWVGTVNQDWIAWQILKWLEGQISHKEVLHVMLRDHRPN